MIYRVTLDYGFAGEYHIFGENIIITDDIEKIKPYYEPETPVIAITETCERDINEDRHKGKPIITL